MWQQLYSDAFVLYVADEVTPTDSAEQACGIDRWILLENGERIPVEEKVRHPRKDGRIFTDVALEVWSSVSVKARGPRLPWEGRGTPGWIQKKLDCEYLVYVNLMDPMNRIAYLFIWRDLQHAWRVNRKAWAATYGEKETPPNYSKQGELIYHTINVSVPVHVLEGAGVYPITVRLS